jgi:hypothetical protein
MKAHFVRLAGFGSLLFATVFEVLDEIATPSSTASGTSRPTALEK